MHLRRFALLGLAVCALAGNLKAQPARLKLDHTNGLMRLGVTGPAGSTYTVEEGGTSLLPNSWAPLVTLTLSGTSQSWLDTEPNAMRFYRALQLDGPPVEFPEDFRLIDHLGVSRSLYYHYAQPGVAAVVLLFTGNGCAKVEDMIPTIKALTNRFSSQGVLFWMIDSSPDATRSNILAEAVSLGISNGPPILHDAAQLVARTYHAGKQPEAVAIETGELTVFYRGAIDDRRSATATPTTQHYLSNALVNFLAGAPVSPSRTRPAGCDLEFLPPYTGISYSADIAPLLQTRCVRCHSPGNIAPWAMTNYNSIQLRAVSIRQEVLAGRMPPWHADPHYGEFSNNSSLRPEEARKLLQWLDEGAYKAPAEPDPLANQPPVTNYPLAWPDSLGQPAGILRIPLQNIPATGTVGYRYITVTNTLFSTNVWLRAAIVRPGNTRVVHHSLVFEGDPNQSLGGLAGFFSGYVPGFDATTFPENTGKLLRPGQVFTFQMHYTTAGSAQTDQTEIGFYLAPAPPAYPLQTRSAFNIAFNIPANSRDYTATAYYPSSGNLTTNILLYEMSPHMHLRGTRFTYDVTYPNGSREILLSVPNYIFHWQALYRFATPKYIPKGSQIRCVAGWDNTAQNTELMEEYEATGDTRYLPGNGVRFGEQSYQEMFIGYLNFAEVP